jgi:hypothetical protein
MYAARGYMCLCLCLCEESNNAILLSTTHILLLFDVAADLASGSKDAC